MLCSRPYSVRKKVGGLAAVGCGQCKPCRINKKREWAARIYAETREHKHNAFVTLTLADTDQVDWSAADLVPRHLTLFWKALRNAGLEFRYFAIGEYGEKLGRPHYHAALFGYQPRITFDDQGHFRDEFLAERWGRGIVNATEMTGSRANYLAGYCVKKWTKVTMDGRHPEFSRQSRDPPIGGAHFVKMLTTSAAAKALAYHPVIPRQWRIEGRKYPVSESVRNYAHKCTGIPLELDQMGPHLPEFVPDITWDDRQRSGRRAKMLTDKHHANRKFNGSPF